ncbi:hypothetical protein HYH02_007152 [Chlamydomonas schloesseri]|uniref:Uncharacterized protein n=1 Tax=Chlamydomonas schloesseri TaxID=2026947 RepID=A0A835WHX0_9CHLO|nr:hypothetical protein HYH02_007152 [Chlamydomonas schloesseri]|eukprot:KAG2447692.1 hypothetical protein HYH02_007152 [Chlamydomonas schloesseri]
MLSRSSDGGAGTGAGGGHGGGSTRGKPVGSGGGGESSGSGGGFVGWYMSCLEANPLLTKSLTCALLNALGDIFCQLFIEKGSSLDLKRTGTFTFLGMFLVGPTLHFWYSALNKLVPARGATGAVLQLLLDQGVFAPLFLATFISVLFTIDGKPHMIKPKLEQDWFETIKVNWVLWIPAQYFNFRFVPPNLQVLVANVVALVWNTYMSFQSHKAVVPATAK